MTDEEYEDYCRQLVDSFPPITPEAKIRIGEALRAGVTRRDLPRAS